MVKGERWFSASKPADVNKGINRVFPIEKADSLEKYSCCIETAAASF